MTASRLIIAALVGGIVTFFWGYVDHMYLPMAEMGQKALPPQGEQMIMNAMNFSLKERAFYRFPACDEKACADMNSEAGKKAWDDFSKKYSAGPRGVIIYDPETGVEAMGPRMLITEAASNIIAAFFLACIIGLAGGGFTRGAGIGAAAGLFAAMSIDISYMNWDRFPTQFALAGVLEQSIGGLLSGAFVGLILGKSKASMAAAPALA